MYFLLQLIARNSNLNKTFDFSLKHAFVRVYNEACLETFSNTFSNSMAEMNLGRFGTGSFWLGSFLPGSFWPIFRVGRFGLGRWVVSAHFRDESFEPRFVSAKVYRNY